MIKSKLPLLSFLASAGLAPCAQGQVHTTDSLAQRLRAGPIELYAADSGLRIVNLWRLEAADVLGTERASHANVLDQLTRDVYRPYPSFWQGYLGNETHFREWAETTLLAKDHPIHTRVQPLLELRLDSLFTGIASWLVSTTGRRPRGVWYIVFGPGWTDMGGFSDGTMLADFTKIEPIRDTIAFKLAHELTHMLHGASNGQRSDPDSGTVLQRIISEGLASYATYAYGAGRLSAAQSVAYSDTDWTWALAHEAELIGATRPYLRSRTRADLNRFASRSERVVAAGAPAVAYFLGFRIVQEYVAKHGPASWADLIDLPVRDVVSRSGYGL